MQHLAVDEDWWKNGVCPFLKESFHIISRV